MADSTNNPQLVKLHELRKEPAMVALEKRTKYHYKEATKSVALLRVDFLTAHNMLSKAGCAGQFSAWLKIMDIKRATAYYILGKKKNGKFSAEGTGKWGAPDPKPLTKKQKQASKRKATKVFTKRIIAKLKAAKTSQKAREMLAKLFSAAFPEAAPLTSNAKTFNLAKQVKLDNDFLNTPAGRWMKSNQEMLARMSAEQLKTFDSSLNAVPKKPAASVKYAPAAAQRAQA